jgi:hypothetical protein
MRTARAFRSSVCNELYGVVQGLVPYTLEVGNRCEPRRRSKDNTILIGTVEGNAEIKGMVAAGLISAPARDEGYTITCFTSKEHGRQPSRCGRL